MRKRSFFFSLFFCSLQPCSQRLRALIGHCATRPPMGRPCIDYLPQRGNVVYGSSRESRFKAGAAPQLWGAVRRRRSKPDYRQSRWSR